VYTPIKMVTGFNSSLTVFKTLYSSCDLLSLTTSIELEKKMLVIGWQCVFTAWGCV